jgi:RNA polymerase sigma-70 factor (ECF subfamily)
MSLDASPTPDPRGAAVLTAGAAAESRVVPSFGEIYAAQFSFVWRMLRRLGVREDRLDDVLQDVFLTVSQRLPKFDPERAHLRSWIYGIVSNLVANERRRWRRKDQPLLPLATDNDSSPNIDTRLASPGGGPAQALEDAEAFRLAAELLETIPEERREVLMLADLEEMPMVEVAESLGINVNTAYSRLRTARRELDEALARHHARTNRGLR